MASFVRVFRKVTGLPPGAHRKSGRDEEIDLLLRRWARAKAGDGQIVLVSGETRHRQVAYHRRIGGALSRRATFPSALFLLALLP